MHVYIHFFVARWGLRPPLCCPLHVFLLCYFLMRVQCSLALFLSHLHIYHLAVSLLMHAVLWCMRTLFFHCVTVGGDYSLVPLCALVGLVCACASSGLHIFCKTFAPRSAHRGGVGGGVRLRCFSLKTSRFTDSEVRSAAIYIENL
jgi:hypothetical protein